MTCDEIRLENARALAQRAGGHAALAVLLDMDPPQINHLIGKNPKRNIGNSIARRMELVCEVPTGWLDVYHPPEPNLMLEVSPEEARLVELYRSSPTTKVLIDGAVNTSFNLHGTTRDARNESAT